MHRTKRGVTARDADPEDARTAARRERTAAAERQVELCDGERRLQGLDHGAGTILLHFADEPYRQVHVARLGPARPYAPIDLALQLARSLHCGGDDRLPQF